LTDINEKFQKYISEKNNVDVDMVYESYVNGEINETELLRSINPALTRVLSTFFNGPKIEKAVRHYIKINKDFKDNHTALLAAAKDTHIDYRTLEKMLMTLIKKGVVPKTLAVREDFEHLSNLLNTMNDITEELKNKNH